MLCTYVSLVLYTETLRAASGNFLCPVTQESRKSIVFNPTSFYFYQLFTSPVCLAGSVVPVLYALFPNKTQATYQRILTEVSNLRHLNPETIVTDFEHAMYCS